MSTRLRQWMCAREDALVLAVLVPAVVLRTLLVLESPTPFGYVWDFYHEGVRILFTEGRLPVAADCWQCYHPPLFYLAGWPWYALGRAIGSGEDLALRLTAGMALPAAAVVVFYGCRLLRLFGCRGASFVTGLALLLATPVLFISSYGAEADIVVTALLSAFVFYLTRYAAHPSAAGTGQVVLIGALAGLAIATKYSGFVGLATAGIVFGIQLLRGPDRGRTVAHGLAVLAVCLAIGGWKYVDNLQRYGRLMHANGSASEGLSLGARGEGAAWELTTLRLTELAGVFGRQAPRGDLTVLPVYRSVPTTLHALVWSDMSFFSNRTRHGAPEDPYPFKRIPPRLSMAVIVLGFVPEALALMGLLVSIRRRALLPLVVFSAVTLGAYLWWVMPQDSWALKSKYVLCLLPVGVLYAMIGQAWLGGRLPAAAALTAGALVLLVITALVYQYAFVFGL